MKDTRKLKCMVRNRSSSGVEKNNNNNNKNQVRATIFGRSSSIKWQENYSQRNSETHL